MKVKFILFSGVLILLLSFCCFGETIILKTGKTIEGRVIKETGDHIIVDIDGVPINYYYDEIVSIGAKKVNKPGVSTEKSLTKDTPAGSGNTSVKPASLSWQAWYAGIKGYMDKFESITKRSRMIAQEQAEKLEKAENDPQLQKKIIIEGNGLFAALFNEFSAVTPPQELKNFHEKLLESYEYVKKINEAILRKDNDSAFAYNRTANALTLEAFSELRNIYIKYGAPQNTLESVNRIIAQCLEFTDRGR